MGHGAQHRARAAFPDLLGSTRTFALEGIHDTAEHFGSVLDRHHQVPMQVRVRDVARLVELHFRST
jgi:hypothetical protein